MIAVVRFALTLPIGMSKLIQPFGVKVWTSYRLPTSLKMILALGTTV